MKRCSLFITGAKTEEVALMNGLTVNLHLLMVRDKHLCQHSEEENTTRRKTDVKKDSKWQFLSLFCSFPSTNQRQLATKSSWKTKPFLQTTWVNLQMFEQTHKTPSFYEILPLLLEFLSHKSSFYFLVVMLLHFDSSSDKKRESQRSPDVKSWWSNTETTNEPDSCLLSCPQYAVESQIQLRGFDPQQSMLLLKARPVQEQTVHTQFGCFAVS